MDARLTSAILSRDSIAGIFPFCQSYTDCLATSSLIDIRLTEPMPRASVILSQTGKICRESTPPRAIVSPVIRLRKGICAPHHLHLVSPGSVRIPQDRQHCFTITPPTPSPAQSRWRECSNISGYRCTIEISFYSATSIFDFSRPHFAGYTVTVRGGTFLKTGLGLNIVQPLFHLDSTPDGGKNKQRVRKDELF